MIRNAETLFIKYIRLKERVPAPHEYPYTVPALAHFRSLHFRVPVTFIMGENGMGKSTLLEAIAVKAGFNAEGGSKNFRFSTCETHSALFENLVLGRGAAAPRDGYFLRAESFYNVATQIDRIADGIHRYYCDRSLHRLSHGESFLALLNHRLHGDGLYLMDEPEAALSPARQMSLLCRMKQLADQGSQFIVSTHSPIVLSYPGADIYEITGDGLRRTELEQTAHYQLLRRFVLDREGMLRRLELDKP